MRVVHACGMWCAVMFCWSGFRAGSVVAGEFAYGAGYSVMHDSNITRVPTNPVADWTKVLSGGFGYRENTVDLNARVVAQAERLDYVRNSFSDDSRYSLVGSAVWTLSPRQFLWTVDDTFQQVRLDLTTPDIPTNRTETNTLSMGPDATLRLDSTNSLDLGARYGRLDIRGPGDNERYTGKASWLHQMSAVTTLSLNYETTRVSYTPPASFTKSLREDLFASYATRESNTNSVTIEAGTTSVTPDGGEKQYGRRALLSAARQLTSESALRVLLAREITETYRDLLGGLANPSGQGSTTFTTDIYRSRRGDLAYAVQGGRLGYTLQGYTRRIDYEQLVDQDYKERGGRIDLTWLYSGDMRFQANADYLRRTFLNSERSDVERNIKGGVTYRLTRSFSVVAEGERITSESSDPGGSNFVNRRAMLLLAYSSGPLYAAPTRR